MSVSELEIILERSNRVFFAGEVVRGTIAIVTLSNLNCRGFHIRFQGRAEVHWHQGTKSGSNQQDFVGSTVFQSQRHTLMGSFYKTALLGEAGDVVPYSGVLRIPCDLGEEVDDKFKLIVRVMDYARGKRDDILGEIVLNVNALVHERDQQTFRLRRRGRAEQGQLTVSAKWLPFESVLPLTSRYGERVSSVAIKPLCLELTIHNATGLRKAGLLGQNDVYCQVYRIPEDAVIEERRPLPDPPTKILLPEGRSLFPFAFAIRTDAAGSSELPLSECARIRYDLYANINKAFLKGHSKKVPITVIPNRPCPQPILLNPVVYTLSDQPIHKQPMCGCAPQLQGLVSIKLCINRRSFAVGEHIDLSASTVDSAASVCLGVTIAIVLHVEMSTRPVTTRRWSITLWTSDVSPNSKTRLAHLGLTPETIRMPNLFPSFDGGVSLLPRRYACLRWSYTIDMTVASKRSVEDVCASVPVLVAAAPPRAHVLRGLSGSPRLELPTLIDPFSIFSDALFSASVSETTPRVTGPEDGGYYVQANGVPEAMTSFDEEEDVGTIGENPPFNPLVHAVAVGDSKSQAFLVLEAEAVSALPKFDDKGENFDTVERLLTALDTSVDKRLTVGAWIRDHPTRADHLTPEQVGLIFSKIQFALEQPSIAVELVDCIKQNLTCAHVCAAVKSCPYQQAEVASIMAPFVQDPHQKDSILALIAREFERVELAEACFPSSGSCEDIVNTA